MVDLRFSWPRRAHPLTTLGATALGAVLLIGCSPQGLSPTQGDPNGYEAQLAQHLATTGGVMYGAYWCPHCADQKAMFRAAGDQVPYIECAADGDNAQPEVCQQRGIQGYPTWEIDGQLYPGVKSLDELAALSGFPAPQ
ncbi:MAG TPA: protein disulfide isomerase family protein [Nodosilinea sp.]|nr:protein disulfide isomerase family protein [Nodosilinea sp.]